MATFEDKFVTRMNDMFFCAYTCTDMLGNKAKGKRREICTEKWEKLPEKMVEMSDADFKSSKEKYQKQCNDTVNYYFLDKITEEEENKKEDEYIIELRKHMSAEPHVKKWKYTATEYERDLYKQYKKTSHAIGKLWGHLKKFRDGTLKNTFANQIEKGIKPGLNMSKAFKKDKEKLMADYLEGLFKKFTNVVENDYNNSHKEQFQPNGGKEGEGELEYEYVKWCKSVSYNDYINQNLFILYNNYIRLISFAKEKFKKRCKNDWNEALEGKQNKDNINRLLYYVFEKDDLQYNKEIKDPNSTWKCGQRIMNTLFLEKFRVASWADEGNPIVLYDGDICKRGGCPGEVYISEKKNTVYTITAGKFLDILIEAKNYHVKTSKQQLRVLIRMNTNGQIDRDPKNTPMNNSLLKKLEEYKKAKGDGNKNSIEGVLVYRILGNNRYEYENNETLLIKEKDIASYAITRKDVSQDAKKNNWKQNLDKMFKGWNKGSGFKSLFKTSDEKSRKKKKEAADKKEMKKAQDAIDAEAEQKKENLNKPNENLFHNETILYAQPVERHYSPMERATYGMDKLELEDITFKF